MISVLANPSLMGVAAEMPPFGSPGRTYYATDTETLYTDTGSEWQVTTYTAGVSVALTVPARQTVAGSPLTNEGTLAISDNAQAENNLATAYRYGEGVTPDIATAAQYYARAAAAGEPNAQNSLGYLAYTGTGIPQNYAQAAALFTQAAQAGLPEAEVNLGLSYAAGNGVPKNPELGAAWIYAGLAHGAKSAPTALAVITPALTPQQLAAARAQAATLK